MFWPTQEVRSCTSEPPSKFEPFGHFGYVHGIMFSKLGIMLVFLTCVERVAGRLLFCSISGYGSHVGGHLGA